MDPTEIQVWLYAEIKTLGDIPRHYARTMPDRMALLDSSGPTSFAELDVCQWTAETARGRT